MIGVHRCEQRKNSHLLRVKHGKKLKKTCMHKQPVDKHRPNRLNTGTAATDEEINSAFMFYEKLFRAPPSGSRKLLSLARSKTTGIFGRGYISFFVYISLPVFPHEEVDIGDVLLYLMSLEQVCRNGRAAG